LPYKRITVNLSPADLPKEGSHYDVPIALGLLAAMSVLPSLEMAGCLAMGELSLDGAIVPVAGVLPAAIKALELGAYIHLPRIGRSRSRVGGRVADRGCSHACSAREPLERRAGAGANRVPGWQMKRASSRT
jgi:hypothetical protein